LGAIVQLGVDYLITENLSVQVMGNYTSFKAKAPSDPWPTRSSPTVGIDTLSAELALAWHW
jgi:outer membrane protein W